MKYAIYASVESKDIHGTMYHQIPLFYLDSAVQGIVSARHAEKIAKDIVNPTGHPALQAFCHATPIWE
jgi:hypothetical protein